MPKVVDAARVTTKDGAVWRHCSTCDVLAAMPAEVTVCDSCRPVPRPCSSARCDGWERVYRYAALVGHIEAWADDVPVPGVSDADRLVKIREALVAFAAERVGGRS